LTAPKFLTDCPAQKIWDKIVVADLLSISCYVGTEFLLCQSCTKGVM